MLNRRVAKTLKLPATQALPWWEQAEDFYLHSVAQFFAGGGASKTRERLTNHGVHRGSVGGDSSLCIPVCADGGGHTLEAH
jgi:hypothetical protein